MSGELTTGWVARTLRERGSEVHAGPDVSIRAGAADSRLVQPGDLFAAFRGESLDGNEFVGAALAAGAVAVVCERAPDELPANATVAVVDDTTAAMHALARAWREECGPRVIGITGTVGKTTTKELTAAALRTRLSTHWSTGNFNSREGLPLALMSLHRDHEVSVLEMGMDSPGEIELLCETARPDIGVVLNIGLTHVSKLGSIDAIAREKLSLPRWLSAAGTAVLNADDPRVIAAAPELRARVISFGESPEATLRATSIADRGLAGTKIAVSYDGKAAEVCSPIPGRHTVPAALTAVAAGLALGFTLDEAAAAVASADVAGRLEVRTTTGGVVILDDRYNASPASVAGALRLLSTLGGRRYALLGVMAELGEHEAAEHRRVGEVAAASCDGLFAVGEACRAMVEAARAAGLADAHWFASKDEAAAELAGLLHEGDHVLVKASRSQAFETVIPLLESAQ